MSRDDLMPPKEEPMTNAPLSRTARPSLQLTTMPPSPVGVMVHHPVSALKDTLPDLSLLSEGISL